LLNYDLDDDGKQDILVAIPNYGKL